MFNTKISLYSIMILVSLIVNIIVVLLTYKKNKFSKYEIIGALVYENIGIIFGSKLLTYLEHYQEYDNFDFYSLGLSSFGAVIGAIVCLIIFGIQFRKSFKDMLFTFMPSIPLMYAIGKVGCYLVGCCYGIEYHGIGHIIYHYSEVAPYGMKLFPVQILETFVFILIFIYMLNKLLKDKFDWNILGISFILCGISKFLLDFFRMSHIGKILSINQVICLLFIFVGSIVIFYNKKLKA